MNGTMTSFTSRYRKDRDIVRELHAAGKLPLIEIHVNTPIATCEQRDLKGLYKKVRAGQLKKNSPASMTPTRPRCTCS